MTVTKVVMLTGLQYSQVGSRHIFARIQVCLQTIVMKIYIYLLLWEVQNILCLAREISS